MHSCASRCRNEVMPDGFRQAIGYLIGFPTREFSLSMFPPQVIPLFDSTTTFSFNLTTPDASEIFLFAFGSFYFPAGSVLCICDRRPDIFTFLVCSWCRQKHQLPDEVHLPNVKATSTFSQIFPREQIVHKVLCDYFSIINELRYLFQNK